MRRLVLGLGGMLAALLAPPAAACLPKWAMPGPAEEWAVVYVARVTSVNSMLGRVKLAAVRHIKGTPPSNFVLGYDNLPWRCGMQNFKPGELVFVFSDRDGFTLATNKQYVDDPALLAALPIRKH